MNVELEALLEVGAHNRHLPSQQKQGSLFLQKTLLVGFSKDFNTGKEKKASAVTELDEGSVGPG